VICEELPAVTWPQGRLEHRLQFGKGLGRGIRAHAVVVFRRICRRARNAGLDLALEKTLRLARLASRLWLSAGVGIGLRARVMLKR